MQFRLESEYGAASRLEAAPWRVVRWLPTEITEEELDALLPTGARLAYDIGKNPVVLFQTSGRRIISVKPIPKTGLSNLPPGKSDGDK